MTFDWSSSPKTTQWAAFYSDVEHEVFPVTSGHRFTLTYNLYHTLPTCHPASLNITTSPLHKELQAALKTPHFMREGGTLGFFCRYRYVECESDKFLKFGGAPLAFLKGEDTIIYRVAESLGLSVQLKAICGGRHQFFCGGLDDDYHDTDFIVPSFQHKVNGCINEESDDEAMLAEAFGSVENAKNVHWCVWTEERKVPLLSTIHYGNEATVQVYYQSAALLMEVPKFTSGRGVAVFSCLEQANEEIRKIQAELTEKKTVIEEVEADIEAGDRQLASYQELKELTSDEKMLQNRYTDLVTERNELTCMVPPNKRARIEQ